MIIKRAATFIFLTTILSAAMVPPVRAQENKLSLTITPPFVQLSISPGEYWASSLKVVNTNPTDLTVYAATMNFDSAGEDGQARFAPALEKDPASLAAWIEISADPVRIAPGETGEIHYAVRVPKNAPPGGHYAAILVGTKPFNNPNISGSVMRVSSFVSALMFLRVNGEVRESGFIREFTAMKSFYDTPDVGFSLRFENNGNVHLRPQGEIDVVNMWGKSRGKVPINQATEFGNVLPGSTRRFEFGWQGDPGLFDIGRYAATITLTYGESSKQNISRTIYFWVIPVKETIAVLGSILLLVLLIVVGIRMYIRKALSMEVGRYQSPNLPGRGEFTKRPHRASFSAPLREGIVDLRIARGEVPLPPGAARKGRWLWLLGKYRTPLVFFALFLICIAVIISYLNSVSVDTRPFTSHRPGEQVEQNNSSP